MSRPFVIRCIPSLSPLDESRSRGLRSGQQVFFQGQSSSLVPVRFRYRNQNEAAGDYSIGS